MKFEYSAGEGISNKKLVRVKQMNSIIEVMSLQTSCTALQDIKKLSKEEYCLKSTGEIFQYKLSENRAQNVAGLKESFGKIRDLINNNYTGAGNELHLTLTYAENMKDIKRLYRDFQAFWQRYKYKYGNDTDYLSVTEPQARGAWHCHVLIRHNDKESIYIPSKELAELWGQGFIKVKALKGVDNIGAYLSAYLGDIELTPENLKECRAHNMEQVEIQEKKVEGKTKAFIKGGRCCLYPPGMNLYRHSKGIKFPEIKEMEYAETKRIVGNRLPDYSRTITILDEQTDRLLNKIVYEQYNTNRTK